MSTATRLKDRVQRARLNARPKREPRKLSYYETFDFNSSEPVDEVAFRQAFFDEWSQACEQYGDVSRENALVYQLLHRSGWDGHWPSLIGQIRAQLVQFCHPILTLLWRRRALYWLQLWKASKSQAPPYWKV